MASDRHIARNDAVVLHGGNWETCCLYLVLAKVDAGDHRVDPVVGSSALSRKAIDKSILGSIATRASM